MPKVVEPSDIIRLQHGAIRMLPSPSGRCLLAASDTGHLSVFSDAGVQRVILGRKVDSTTLAVDDENTRLAFIDQGSRRLILRDLVTGRESLVDSKPRFQNCCFDEDGHLWTLRTSKEEFVLEHRSAGDWTIQRETKFPCGLKHEGAWLWPGGAPGRVLVHTHGGQSYLGTFDAATGGVSARHLDKLEGDHFPMITSVGGDLIALDHDEYRVIRAAWPYVEILGQVVWPSYDEQRNYAERPGYSACYLDLVHVLVASAEGRLFTLHTRSMEFIQEIEVQGFEPFAGELNSSRVDAGGEELIVSNLQVFGRFGDSIVAFFAGDFRAKIGIAVIIPVSEFL